MYETPEMEEIKMDVIVLASASGSACSENTCSTDCSPVLCSCDGEEE